MDKKQTRRYISVLKEQMSAEERKLEEDAVWARIENLDAFIRAESVLLYCSLPDELSTSDFIARWQGAKRIILPLVSGNSLLLKEHIPGRMHSGYKFIPEPDEDLPDVPAGEMDFAVIPGVAFDANGYRLGRGKGFYDRLLPSLSCPCYGVGYSCQMVPDLPRDSWDIRLDGVICGGDSSGIPCGKS